MSRRTSDANKVISAAWAKEQQLVCEGKGTRDWTPEQQQDIFDRGKAYDDNGKALEGHHMKSAEKFPKYQGNLQNIQFLSRSEHFNAHNGNFQNPTNGFYNPNTSEMLEFDLDKVEPCEVIELSELIINTNNAMRNSKENTEHHSNNDTNFSEVDRKRINLNETTPTEDVTTKRIVDVPKSPNINTSKKKRVGIGNQILRVADAAQKFSNRHPILTEIGKWAGLIVLSAAAGKAVSNSGKSSNENSNSDNNYIPPTNTKTPNESSEELLTSSVQSSDDIVKSSPSEHTVSPHRQRYNGVWKDKESYSRGKKDD
ncbi:teneurin-3 [Lachnospiraceae bacterium LCP25S3_G4]